MKGAPSILNRIMALHLAAFAGISTATVLAAFLLLNASVNSFERSVLGAHAHEVAQYLRRDGNGWTLALPADLQNLYRKGHGRLELAVVADDGSTLFSSLPSDTPRVTGPQRRTDFTHRQVNGMDYYWLTLPQQRGEHMAWIQVGQNQANPDVIVDDVVTRFVARIVWIVLPIFAILFVIDVLLLRRLFRPVVDASRIAAAIRPSNPSSRLPLQGLPREVRPLAEAINQALDRLEHALRAQREFTADAAHELRTPLAILRTEIDMTLDNGTARRFHGDIDAMSHVLDQLQELAELEGEPATPTDIVDLGAMAADAVGLMAPLALAKGKTIELQAPPGPVRARGSQDMLFRALRNLIENAIRHTQPTGRIVVMVEAPANLIVADDGPGIAPADRQLVFRRFWRRDRDTRDHAGLGLAIVNKIAQLHGGTVDITDNPGGGAMLTIRLPPMPAA